MTKYKPSNKVLAYHGPLIYEARVLKVHETGKNYVIDGQQHHEPLGDDYPGNLMDVNSYLLHYKGWKLKWDEWVTEDRIMEYNNEHWNLSKKLRSEYNQRMRHKPADDTTTTGSSTNGTSHNNTTTTNTPNNGSTTNTSINGYNIVMKGIKRRLGDDKPKKNKDIIISMANELKSLLVDDWEYITKDHKIINVPVAKPVHTILQDYVKFEVKYGHNLPSDINIINEFITGLETYFNQTLKIFLLYKYERLQYANCIKDYQQQDQPLPPTSELYGLEHLLRLIITLPGLISNTTMDNPSINVMTDSCSKFLKFLAISFNEYLNDYENTSPAYDNLARS